MKTNSIYEALNNVDDKFVSEAAKVRGKRPMALMITTASLAASLALAVGIRNWGGAIGNYISPADAPVKQDGASYEAPGFGESDSDQQDKSETMKIKLRKGDNTDYGIMYNVTLQEYTIPEEFLSSNIYGFEDKYTDTVPSELFPKFGITMLTSDNFTDTKSVYNRSNYHGNIYSWEPSVWISSEGGVDTQICFIYYLYDKKIDRNIRFASFYISNTRMLEWNKKFGYVINSDEDEKDAEVITLNDGSQCVVTDSEALFSYNGVRYDMSFDRNDFNTSSIEELKQVLADLGVL